MFKILMSALFSFLVLQIFAQDKIVGVQKFEDQNSRVTLFRDMMVQDKEGDYYLLMSYEFGSEYLYVGDTKISKLDSFPNLPEGQTLDEDQLVLVKLDGQDFNLINYVRLTNMFLDNGDLYLYDHGVSVVSRKNNFYIKDSVYLSESESFSSVFHFENDLNDIYFTSIDNELEELAIMRNGDIFMRYSVGAGSDSLFVGHGVQYMANPQLSNSALLRHSTEQVCVILDKESSELKASWKFGGEWPMYLRRTSFDDRENSCFVGGCFRDGFTFNNVDTVLAELSMSNNFIAKYDNKGELIFGYFSDWYSDNWFLRSFTDNLDQYVSGSISGDSMIWNNQIVYNYENEEKDLGERNAYLAKLTIDGALDWIYQVPGYLRSSEVEDVTFKNDMVYVVFSVSGGEVQIDNKIIPVPDLSIASQIHILDRETGELLGYKSFEDLDRFHLISYLEYQEEHQAFDMLFEASGSYELFSESLGTEDKTNKYLLRIEDLDFNYTTAYYTQVPVIEVYPNPATQFLNILDSQVNARVVRYSIFDIQGKVVQKIESARELNNIDVTDLASGIYFLQVIGEVESVVKFIKM